MGRKSEAKEKLVETAMSLIHSRSYSSVTVEDICEHADVRRGSLHYFFRTKQSLALAAVEENWRKARGEVLEEVFSRDIPPRDRIARYLEAVYEVQARLKAATGHVPGCEFGSLSCELSTQNEEVRNRLQEVFEGAVEYIASAVEDAVKEGSMPGNTDAQATGRAILAYVEGLLVLSKTANDPEVIRQLGSGALDLSIPRAD